VSLPAIVYKGGELLSVPRVVTVTFRGDPLAADLDAFGASIVSSAWWDTVRFERCASGGACVDDGPAGTSVQLSTDAPATFTDSDNGAPSTVQTWLLSAIDDGSLPPPAPAPSGAMSSTVYLIYLPGTTLVDFDGLMSCVPGGFSGYHNHVTLGQGQAVPYAIVSECTPPPPPSGSGMTPPTTLDTTTVTASHEILETATDPDGHSGFGMRLDRVDNWSWLDIVGGDEAADLCIDPFGMYQDMTQGVMGSRTFAVQRIWSDVSVAAGHDPCVPAPAGQVYFNAAPRTAFFVLDVGESTTFDVDAYADGPIPGWMLFAQDWSGSGGYLDLAIEGGQTSNAGPKIVVTAGQTLHVTASLTADPSDLPSGEADGALVSVSGSGSPPVAHYWPFAVMSREHATRIGLAVRKDRDGAPVRPPQALTALGLSGTTSR